MSDLDIYIRDMKEIAEAASKGENVIFTQMAIFAYRTAEDCKKKLNEQRKDTEQ